MTRSLRLWASTMINRRGAPGKWKLQTQRSCIHVSNIAHVDAHARREGHLDANHSDRQGEERFGTTAESRPRERTTAQQGAIHADTAERWHVVQGILQQRDFGGPPRRTKVFTENALIIDGSVHCTSRLSAGLQRDCGVTSQELDDTPRVDHEEHKPSWQTRESR